jgi:choline dehydrogenase-like flavoprotein
VVDGSVFVTSSGTNPTSTIAALAMRTAEHMVQDRSNQAVPV